LLNLKSTGLKARRMAGGDAGMEITKKILEINKKNKTTKKKKEETKTETNKTGAGIPKINPFLKKKRRNKSVLAAARQMRASRKMKVRMALLSKQKAIDFLSNLDFIQDFIQHDDNDDDGAGEHGGNSDGHPKWTDSKYNWRVAALEHAGRAPPTVDVKTLRKQWDPEEDENVLLVREQEKSTSVALVSRGGRSSGLSDSFNGGGDLVVDLQSSSVNVGKKRSPKKKKKKKRKKENEAVLSGLSMLSAEVEKAAMDYVEQSEIATGT
jgi:hypothetical protein